MNILKILLSIIVIIMVNFSLWRKWREEYLDKEIFGYSLFITFLAGMGGIIGAIAEAGKVYWGISGWGVVLALFFGTGWWSKTHHWDWWETMDQVASVSAWMWLVLSLLSIGNPDYWIKVIFAGLGLVIAGYLKNNYRHIGWYKSGKMGLVSLVLLGWYALTEITVAFITPVGIYWGGLKPGQWVSAYLAAFVIVNIYLRSGRKIREGFRWILEGRHGKK